MNERCIKIIGITGTSRAGKGELTQYLVKNYGAQHLSMSGEMAKVLEEKGLPPTRENLINVGNELREKNGSDYFARRLINRTQKMGGVNVIESLRNHAEVIAVQKAGGVVIAVDADIRIRYDRSQINKNEKDAGSFEEFERKDTFERNSGIPGGQNIEECMAMANYHLTNNGTVEEFFIQIDNICGLIFQSH